MIYDKQRSRPIRFIGSYGLTNNFKDDLTKYDTKTVQISKNNSSYEIEAEGLLCQKSIRILTVLRCISGPNWVILAGISDKLWCGQSQNGINFYFQIRFHLEGLINQSPKQ